MYMYMILHIVLYMYKHANYFGEIGSWGEWPTESGELGEYKSDESLDSHPTKTS